MNTWRTALAHVAVGAVVGGLESAETIDVSSLFGLTGDSSALATGIFAMLVSFALNWVEGE